jgi:hypothetical protein
MAIAFAWFANEWRVFTRRQSVSETAAVYCLEHGFGVYGEVGGGDERISWFRSILGDEPISDIWIDDRLPQAMVDQIQAAFPASEIHKRDDKSNPHRRKSGISN